MVQHSFLLLFFLLLRRQLRVATSDDAADSEPFVSSCSSLSLFVPLFCPPSSANPHVRLFLGGFSISCVMCISFARATRLSLVNTFVVHDSIASTARCTRKGPKCVLWCSSKHRAIAEHPSSMHPWLPAPPAGVPINTQRGNPASWHNSLRSSPSLSCGNHGTSVPGAACKVSAS